MSTKTFTPEEAAQIAVEYARKRINELAKNLKELRDRELSKAIIPPHKHVTGTTTSAGIEDVAPSRINPPGKNDVVKGAPMEDSPHGEEETSGEKSPADVLDDALSKEELCKKCGKSHDLEKGCTPVHEMDKAMLKDSKGREKDNGVHPDSVLPEDKDSEEVSADGSGGDIKKGKKLGKAVTPPMAKPPSGKNMSTHVPTSKPAMAKEVKEMVVHGKGKDKEKQPPKDADYTVKEKDGKKVYIRKEELEKWGGSPRGVGPGAQPEPKDKPKIPTFRIPTPEEEKERDRQSRERKAKSPLHSKDAVSKEELEKAGLSPQAKQHMLIDASRQAKPQAAAPAPKLPSPAQQAQRAAQFESFMPDAATTGHAPKPGIFGRIKKSESLNKAGPMVPWKTGSSVTQAIPALKPAAAGLHTVGSSEPTATSQPKVGGAVTGDALAALQERARSSTRAIPVQNPLVARPALKPAGAGLATAGASADNTEGDKTPSALTNPAKPTAIAAAKQPKPKV